MDDRIEFQHDENDIFQDNEALIAEDNARIAPDLDPIIDKLIEEADFQPPPPNPLKPSPSVEEIKTAYRKVLFDTFSETKSRIDTANGFDIILANLKRVSNAELCEKEIKGAAEILTDNILNELITQEKILSDLSEKVKNNPLESVDEGIIPEENLNSRIQESIATAPPFMELMGISESTFASMYEIGLQLFDENSLQEAASVFTFLSLLNGACHEVWFSAGLCYHRLNNLSEAASNYALAIQTDASNVQAFINLAMCYAALDDQIQVDYTLTLAEETLKALNLPDVELNARLAALVDAKKHVGEVEVL